MDITRRRIERDYPHRLAAAHQFGCCPVCCGGKVTGDERYGGEVVRELPDLNVKLRRCLACDVWGAPAGGAPGLPEPTVNELRDGRHQARVDRRGDRRTAPWTCPSNVERIADQWADRPRCDGTRGELPDGRVHCNACGMLDERSTRENRREAGRELARLEARIERDMAGFHHRLEATEERTVAVEAQVTAVTVPTTEPPNYVVQAHEWDAIRERLESRGFDIEDAGAYETGQLMVCTSPWRPDPAEILVRYIVRPPRATTVTGEEAAARGVH